VLDLKKLKKQYGEFRLFEKRLDADAAEWRSWGQWRQRHAFASGAVVWDEQGRFLLVRHAPESPWAGKWGTPGGAAEMEESPEAAARREILEETGIEVEFLGLDRVNRYAIVHGDGMLRMEYVQFEARKSGGRLRAGGGVVKAKWFTAIPRGTLYREDFEALVLRGPRNL